MNAAYGAFRAFLIGVVAFQTLLLPGGNCCCAVRRLVAFVSGSGVLPACCVSVQDASSDVETTDRLAELWESSSAPADCRCGAGKLAGRQAASKVEWAQPLDWELCWIAVSTLDALPFLGDGAATTSPVSAKPPSLCLSGKETRAVLQSWLC